jgi:hypothetical protein
MQLFSDHLLFSPFASNDDGCHLLLDLLGMGYEILVMDPRQLQANKHYSD